MRTRCRLYYDRCVPDDLLATILPDGPLAWLVSWVRSPDGSSALADLQLRRSRGGTCLQLYLGGTSVLSIHLTRRKVRFRVNEAYKGVAPSLFSTTHDQSALLAARPELFGYLERVRPRISDRYVTAESEVHGGFMRRYALDVEPTDPCLVLDREVKIGYANVAERSAVRLQLDAALPARLRGNYVELDAIAILSTAGIALVEIKDRGDDPPALAVAAEQAAAHVLRFSMLDERERRWRENLGRLAGQKVAAGILPCAPQSPDQGPLVPVIAASDERSDWALHWRSAIRSTLAAHGKALAGLQMWRLSRSGVIDEQATP
jgi:hypothetical protein